MTYEFKDFLSLRLKSWLALWFRHHIILSILVQNSLLDTSLKKRLCNLKTQSFCPCFFFFNSLFFIVAQGAGLGFANCLGQGRICGFLSPHGIGYSGVASLCCRGQPGLPPCRFIPQESWNGKDTTSFHT